MLSIGMLHGGHDVGSYYARDDYYGGDATTIDATEERDPRAESFGLAGSGSSNDDAPLGPERGVGRAVRGSASAPQATEPGGPSTRTQNDDTGEGNADSALGSTRGKGQWYGRGAAALSLSGSVDPRVLNEMIRGTLPNGEQLGTRPSQQGEKQHLGGWDLTFSAPKSVSVLAELSGDRTLFRAHNDAVKEAVRWLEDESAALRRQGWLGRKTEQTGNLVVALFQHDTSREQDPQLHTHALVMNATQRDDGAWRSLYSRPLYEHKMAAGNVYRAALAHRLQVMGYEVERTHADGRFELSAVPQEVLKTFSTRREQVEQKLAAWNAEGAEASAKAALLTRSRKGIVDLPLLREEWKARTLAEGFDIDAVLGAARDRGSIRVQEGPAEQTRHLRNAIDRLAEREATFSHADLMGAVLAEGMGQLDVAAANAVIARNTRSHGLDLYEARLGERKAWTTPAAAEQERRIEFRVAAGRGAVAPAVPRRAVRAAMKQTWLNDTQKAAVELIVASPDQFVAVVGRPGTGKTTMVREAKLLLESRGHVPIGMAPNGAAAKELETVGGLAGARTIASHLARMGKRAAQLQGLEGTARAEALEAHRKEVWVVDEASQMNNRDLRRLVHFASLTGARVAMIGDPAQLGAINAGKPFERLLKNGIRQVEMHQIFRQERALDRALVAAAIDRDIAGALDLLDPHIRTIRNEDDRHAAMVRAWAQSPQREQTLMITMRNAAKARLNDLAREWLQENGYLGAQQAATQLVPVFGSRADRQLAATYQEGDVLRFSRDNPRFGIKRAAYWHVTAVEARDSINQLTLANGEQVITLNARTEKNLMRTVEHFRPRGTALAVNDRIVWNRPDPDKQLVNGDVLVVESVKGGKAQARTSEGSQVTLDAADRKDQHWEHYYATNLYKSQGKTATNVLIDAPLRDAAMMNHHAFLVGVSRHKAEIRFFTDEPEQLKNRIIHNPGDKTSAQEGLSGQRLEWVLPRFHGRLD